MAKRDLTLWEVDEASKYGLTPERYDELKAILVDRFKKKELAATLEQAKSEAIKTAKPKLKEEVKAEIIEDISIKFEQNKRLEIKKELEKEMAAATPSTVQRRDAKIMAQELELDCLAISHAASDSADEQSVLIKNGKWRGIMFFSLLFSYLPILSYLYLGLGWGGNHAAFWAVVVTQLVAVVWAGIANETWREDNLRWLKKYKTSSVDYWNLANNAKEVRMVKINNANTKGEINDLIREISYSKNSLSKEYQPSTKMLEKAKDHIRDTQISDMNLDSFIREDDKVRIETDLLDESEDDALVAQQAR